MPQESREPREKSINHSQRGKPFLRVLLDLHVVARRSASEQFSKEEKQQILESFNGLASKELQDSHLLGLILSKEVKQHWPRVASGKSSRIATYTYHVTETPRPFLCFSCFPPFALTVFSLTL